jgi:peptidoglycan/xylan/chitin deacetylase (PgdA/CDA1 family)
MIACFVQRLRIAAHRWRATVSHRQMRRLRFDRPVLSLTFDDFPHTAATTGAAMVERYGGRATFYAATDYAEDTTHFGAMYTAADIAGLSRRGHEIGCHGHKHYDCTTTPLGVLLDDLTHNCDALMAMGAPRPVSFAFPYGRISAASKGVFAQHVTSQRPVTGGVNCKTVDLNQLGTVGVEGPQALQKGLDALHKGKACNGWVIFYTHDVADTPTQWGITPGDLEVLLKTALELGYEIRTVGDVAQSLANNKR